jgi:hypothetical protein
VTSDRLEVLVAESVLGLGRSEDLPGAALALLQSGFDSPALVALAGLSSADVSEAPQLFDRAVAELSVSTPDPRSAVIRLSQEVAADIAAGTTAPYEGAKRIWALTLRVPTEHIRELDPFIYAASEWEDRPDDRVRFEEDIAREAQALAAVP